MSNHRGLRSFEDELLAFGVKHQAELWWAEEGLARKWIILVKGSTDFIYREKSITLDQWNSYDDFAKQHVHKDMLWSLIEELQGVIDLHDYSKLGSSRLGRQPERVEPCKTE